MPGEPDPPTHAPLDADAADAHSSGHEWTFLTNHSHVLIYLAMQPRARLRDVAAQVGVTERAVQRIVHDLEEAGALTRTREGRRNRYRINAALPLRHPIEHHRRVADLLAMLGVDLPRDPR